MRLVACSFRPAGRWPNDPEDRPRFGERAAGYAVFYAYDLRGLETEARFGSVAGPGVTNAYDGFGRLAASTTNMDGTARTFTSSYDAESNRTRLAISSGYVMNWTFDGLDRMTGLIDGNGEQLVRITYDPAGRRQGLALGPGGASAAAYGYDPAGRLQGLTHDLGGGAFDQALTFAYNPASQIVARTASNDGYASNTAQAVSRPYSVNGLNQYIAAGPATFAYDANGNLTFDGTNSYVYDAENRLVSASGGRSAALAYDPLGRLWQVTGPSGVTRLTYDGDRLTEEYDGSGQWLRLYAHGPNPDEPLIWYELTGGPVRRYLHADHQGSVIASNDDAGNVVGLAGYDAWGIPNSTSLTNVGRLGYTGQAWLPELGMWYYKARLYSPTLGRFLQTDPVGYKDQVNLYAYVGNDPVDGRDPDGTQSAPAIPLESPCSSCHTNSGGLRQINVSLPKIPWQAVAAVGAGAFCVASPTSCATVLNALLNEGKRPSDGTPIREEATPERIGNAGSDDIYSKPGGVDEANADFDKNADADTIRSLGDGVRIGKTPEGDNITVRPSSKAGPPTVEMTRGNGKARMTDKFRYNGEDEE
jgi:RHS repeat-associated protein